VTRYRTTFIPCGLALLLAAFVCVAYLPVVDAPFTFDDYPHIVHDPGAQLDRWNQLPHALSGPGRDRPVARITFGLNYLVAGLDPSAYHLTNVAIHIGSALVLFGLLLALARAPRSPQSLARNALAFAAAGALLWAVHPANTQAVSYVVQRMASMAALFYLATLWAFAAWRLGWMRPSRAIPLILVLWAFALGSKMSAASAPAAWWLIEVAFFTGFTRRNLRLGGVVLAGGLAAAAAVLWSDLDYLFIESPRYGFSGIERMLTEGRVLWHYVSLLVWPDAGRLLIDYDYTASKGLIDPWTTAPALAAWLAIAVLAAVGIHRRRLLWPSVGFLFFLIGSSVEASFIMLDPIFEHRIYLPSMLLVPGLIAPVFGLALSERRWIALRLAVISLAGVLTWQTIERNRLWAEPARLWTQALERGAKEARARANAGIAALNKGRTDDVMRLLGRDNGGAKDTAEAPPSPRLVQVEIVEGQFEQARSAAKRALERRPRSLAMAYLYGMSLFHLGRLEEARAMVRQLYERVPENPAVTVLDALIQERAGAPEAAIDKLMHWLDTHPERSVGQRNLVRLYLANVRYRQGQRERAVEGYREIVQNDPLNWSSWVNLAQVLRASGEIERAEAIEAYLRAREVDVETFKSYALPAPAREP